MGFTLIELVIVLAVLGALSAIAVPQLSGLREEADLRAVASTASSEVNNAFARDLAAGTAENTTNGTGVNWSEAQACESVSILGERDENRETVFETLIGFKIWGGSDPPALPDGYGYELFPVPTYTSGDIGSRTCYIHRETS